MIILIEQDKTIRKKLSDLLGRERIIGTDSVKHVLELICKYKNDTNLIIANIHILSNIIPSQIIFKLCEKLSIDIPPIVGFHKKSDRKIKEEFSKNYRQ